MIAALAPYHRLDCQDHAYNTVLKHALDSAELQDSAPEVTQTWLAAKALVRYVKQTGIISQLSTTVRQISDTRFSTVFLTLDSIKQVYAELREKLESRGESRKIDKISPDVLEFLLEFLHPFYQAQRELEGDQYPRLNLVVLWHERLKRHCRPVATDSPHQAIIRERHLEVSVKRQMKLRNHDMEEERNHLGWWKNNSGVFPLLYRYWPIVSSESLQVAAAARGTSVQLD
ncbi:hypothetical protein DPEC_G00017540 [Dallia pectoralis]|uniref:Uncharacterized protein n=1 Tax=Dallia pectoralis TaxID=75939 RepID=A0ACC2HF37_DALPE|nr:hypothetical protein DPEC_G00017540 [Dallia pectoralis]